MAWQDGKRKSVKGRSGEARMKKKNEQVVIQFKGETAKKSFPVENVSNAELLLEDKVYNVLATLTEDETRIYSFYPWKGAFMAYFNKFVSSPDQPPSPVIKRYNWEGQEYSYLGFTALLKIVEGDFNSWILPYPLRYYFMETGGLVAYDKPRSKYKEQLAAFMDATGASDEALLYSDNLLPAIQERILEKDYLLQITVEDGFVTKVINMAEASSSWANDDLNNDDL